MKTITFTLDLKSFCLGVLTVGGILSLANFTPDRNQQPLPDGIDTRRFQAVAGHRETVILDTQTGRFVLTPGYLGQPRWIKGDFEQLQSQEKNSPR